VATMLIIFLIPPVVKIPGVNYYPENKLTKLGNFVQFKRMLRPMFYVEDWGWAPWAPLVYATNVKEYFCHVTTTKVCIVVSMNNAECKSHNIVTRNTDCIT